MTSPAEIVETYIAAKDGQRPWLAARVFAPGVRLNMVNHTDAIRFPAMTEGTEPVTDVLIRRFGAENENVHTFCLGARPTGMDDTFGCHWLVAMSRRDDGSVRVGCGMYDWRFLSNDRHLATDLTITIAVMQVLPAYTLTPVMEWVGSLHYPWVAAAETTQSPPDIEALKPVVAYLRKLD